MINYKPFCDTNSINDCNTSLGEDAMPVATTGSHCGLGVSPSRASGVGTPATRWLMNRVSTNGLFVAFFFQIGMIFASKTLLFSLLLFWDSIKLSLNEFYIYPLPENVTEPTDEGDEEDEGDKGVRE